MSSIYSRPTPDAPCPSADKRRASNDVDDDGISFVIVMLSPWRHSIATAASASSSSSTVAAANKKKREKEREREKPRERIERIETERGKQR